MVVVRVDVVVSWCRGVSVGGGWAMFKVVAKKVRLSEC
jgi:hypothetical protein